MTPAETLAADKQRQRRPRNTAKLPRNAAWKVCNVREHRERLNLSLRDVATALGLSVSSYWQIEKGGDPMLRNAVKIAEFYGVGIGELWGTMA